jgi:hypothetical protein
VAGQVCKRKAGRFTAFIEIVQFERLKIAQEDVTRKINFLEAGEIVEPPCVFAGMMHMSCRLRAPPAVDHGEQLPRSFRATCLIAVNFLPTSTHN